MQRKQTNKTRTTTNNSTRMIRRAHTNESKTLSQSMRNMNNPIIHSLLPSPLHSREKGEREGEREERERERERDRQTDRERGEREGK